MSAAITFKHPRGCSCRLLCWPPNPLVVSSSDCALHQHVFENPKPWRWPDGVRASGKLRSCACSLPKAPFRACCAVIVRLGRALLARAIAVLIGDACPPMGSDQPAHAPLGHAAFGGHQPGSIASQDGVVTCLRAGILGSLTWPQYNAASLSGFRRLLSWPLRLRLAFCVPARAAAIGHCAGLRAP